MRSRNIMMVLSHYLMNFNLHFNLLMKIIYFHKDVEKVLDFLVGVFGQGEYNKLFWSTGVKGELSEEYESSLSTGSSGGGRYVTVCSGVG